MSEKRNRGPNFVESDKYILLRLILKYKNIIESKHIDGNSVKAKKACWDQIEAEYNAMAFHHRSLDSLKYLWDNMKHDVKRILRKQRQASYAGDGLQSIGKAAVKLELSETLQLALSIMESTAEGPEIRLQDDKSQGSKSEALDESNDYCVVLQVDEEKHMTNSELFSNTSSPSLTYQPSTPNPLPSSSTGPTPTKKIAIENVSGHKSSNIGRDITSCIESPDSVVETLHQPPMDPVDACMQFLSSMLKEFRSEELRLETMNELVKTVIQAKTSDLQQARKLQ
ncbi:hypothetical protein C0J52_00910 [Blattella germanica]|nr:hypothetical protein C0J52_00910 [Blattella germanica]